MSGWQIILSKKKEQRVAFRRDIIKMCNDKTVRLRVAIASTRMIERQVRWMRKLKNSVTVGRCYN